MLQKPLFRIVALVSVVCIFAVSSGVIFSRYAETSKLLSVSLKTGAWSASELESDMLKLMHALELFQLGNKGPETLILRYDLLWSRVNVLQAGDETLEVRSLDGVNELLASLERTLEKHEQSVQEIKPGEAGTAVALALELREYAPAIRNLTVNSFNGPDKLQKLEQARKLQKGFSFSLIGLLFSGGLLVVMLLHLSTRHRDQALHDSLTGLPNRKYFNERLKLVEARCKRSGAQMAVHVIDLNDFKNINDTLGHNAGDEMLIKIANRLRNCIRKQDMVARIGGDEFAIIQNEVPDIDSCARLASRICTQVAQPFILKGTQVFPSNSIGISIYPDDTVQADQLLLNADIAMYSAKRDVGDAYRFYEPEMNSVIQRRKELSDDLRKALENDELQLYYQPIVNLNSGLIEGVEALLRWSHDSYGNVQPLEIVSVAEQFALAEKLNRWVLKQACIQNQHWIDQGFGENTMNVNISPAMYIQHDLAKTVEEILKETGMPADRLELEVTEDTTISDIESSPEVIKKLRNLGVSLALDDFGTGYSSLSHLRKLPVQKIKIDKSFIQDLNNVPRDLQFIRTIIRLAHSLGLEVVAEGIEVEENLHVLIEEQCHFGQGYLFSRPLPALEVTQLLQQQVMGKQLYHVTTL